MRVINNIIVTILLFNLNLIAQNREQIEIEFAPFMTFEESKPNATILTRDNTRQVHIKHEGIDMWCNQAIYYAKEDFVEAYGDVKVKQGDSLDMKSKYVEYSGKTQLAYASGDVLLIDNNSKLYTDILYFDRIKQEAYYNQKGKVISDSSGVINSKIGRYYTKTKKYQFNNNVVLVNPEYVIETDRLDFYSLSGYAFLYGPTTITSESSIIYCERGFYNTTADKGYFIKNSRIDYDDRKIEGDSIYFDRNKNYASASNNIKITDSLNKTIIKGHYAELFKAKDSMFITKRALAITIQENDSLYMHSDTLMITGPAESRVIRGFYNAKIFKSDISGKADSIHMNQNTGLTQLINFYNIKIEDAFSKRTRPVLWHHKNQITGDSIHLISNSKSETLDSLKVFDNAFIINKDSLGNGFNQISGKKLNGLFVNNKLSTIEINKNAETIYYLRDSENELVGIDKSKSASIKIWISENKIDELRKLNQIDGNTYPESDFPENQKLLKGFTWREDERPKSVEELFIDDEPLILPNIKGIKKIDQEKDFFDEELRKRTNNADKSNDKKSISNKASQKFPKKPNN